LPLLSRIIPSERSSRLQLRLTPDHVTDLLYFRFDRSALVSTAVNALAES
jgi:hypothetical protein